MLPLRDTFVYRPRRNGLYGHTSFAKLLSASAHGTLSKDKTEISGRNATHIHHLPVELLLAIFEYAALDDRLMGESPASSEISWATPSRRDPSTSFHISHVCHRWRLVALSHRTLWARVPRLHDSWTDAYLSRSPTLLDVEIRPEHFYNATEDHDLMLLYLISRARGLMISFTSERLSGPGTNSRIQGFLRSLETWQAPRLEDLRIDLQRHRADILYPGTQVPLKIFNGQILRTLHTAKFNCVLLRALDTFRWPALRALELNNCLAWESVSSFANLFASVPLLEDFIFGHSAEARLDETLSWAGFQEDLLPLRAVPMNHLRTFKLHGSYSDIFLTLAVLAIPYESLIKLTFADSTWYTTHIDVKLGIMRDALSSHFAAIPPEDAPFYSLTFEGCTISMMPPPGIQSRSPTGFTLSIPYMRELGTLRTLQTHHALAHPVFSRAKHVVLQPPLGRFAYTFDCLWRILNLCSSMKSCSLHGTELYKAFGYLLALGQLDVALPTLSILRLVSVDFSSHDTDVLVEYTIRKLVKLPRQFELLELNQCTIDGHQIRCLRNALGSHRVSLVRCRTSMQH